MKNWSEEDCTLISQWIKQSSHTVYGDAHTISVYLPIIVPINTFDWLAHLYCIYWNTSILNTQRLYSYMKTTTLFHPNISNAWLLFWAPLSWCWSTTLSGTETEWSKTISKTEENNSNNNNSQLSKSWRGENWGIDNAWSVSLDVNYP